jgi:uncharacterized protein YbcV (DUF1398 family)
VAAETTATAVRGGAEGDPNMHANVARECAQGSLAGTLTFPEVVGRLQNDGVERYYADLVQLQTTYYGSDGAVEAAPLPLSDAPSIPASFSQGELKAALVAIQGQRIDYPEFLRRIMAAGTASYTVFIGGRKTIYSGRRGDVYSEEFPRP